jgi:hypothetical protein
VEPVGSGHSHGTGGVGGTVAPSEGVMILVLGGEGHASMAAKTIPNKQQNIMIRFGAQLPSVNVS